MAITRVGSPVEATQSSEADYQDISIDVTSGNVVIVVASLWTTTTTRTAAYDASHLTRVSGSTIGTVVCDVSNGAQEGNYRSGDGAIWRVPVTSTGTLVLRVTAPDTSKDNYTWVAAQQISYSGTLSCQDTNSATFVREGGATGTRSSGDADSTGAALFIGAVSCGTSAADSITVNGSGWSMLAEEENSNNGMSGGFSYREVTGATTDDAAFDLVDAYNVDVVLVAAYQDSGGVARNPVPMGFVVG